MLFVWVGESFMSNTKTKIKRNAKASLFEAIFSRKEYLIQLYRVLHTEDTETTENNLTDITLKNVLYNSQYNDLGFMVGNRLMVLVEAQSTWSRNIVARLLLYRADTWKQIIQSNRYLMYSDSIIELPKPEFYVVYTGQKEVPSKLLLSDIYYKGEKGMLEMEVQVRTLPSGHRPEEPNILDQYILFCQTFDRYRIKYPNDSEKSIKETLEYCEKEGILVSYLKEHRRKAIDTMDLLFDQKAFDKIWKEQNIA